MRGTGAGNASSDLERPEPDKSMQPKDGHRDHQLLQRRRLPTNSRLIRPCTVGCSRCIVVPTAQRERERAEDGAKGRDQRGGLEPAQCGGPAGCNGQLPDQRQLQCEQHRSGLHAEHSG